MKSNTINRPSEDTLSKYFAGECTPEELLSVEQWVGQAENNKEEMERLSILWQDLGSLKSAPATVDVAAAFSNVKAKKEAHTWAPSPFRNIWKVAAALILATSILFILLLREDHAQIQVQAQQVEELALPDGSLLTLNTGASVTYAEHFNHETRQVQLAGEAFFEVAHNPERPFIVTANGVEVKVLGTSFNIRESEQSVEVSVATGQVEVSSVLGTVTLQTGDQLTINLQTGSLDRGQNSLSGTERYWFSKQLTFDAATMKTVIADLKKSYQVNIEVSDISILHCKLQATFQHQSITEVLEIIAISQNLSVEQVNGTYVLSGEGCEH